MDPALTRYPVVWAAAGTQTAVFPVPPGTLRILANATVAPIVEERRAADVEAEARANAASVAVGPGAAAAGPNAEPASPDGAAASNARA